jgi:hypothetical protein
MESPLRVVMHDPILCFSLLAGAMDDQLSVPHLGGIHPAPPTVDERLEDCYEGESDPQARA